MRYQSRVLLCCEIIKSMTWLGNCPRKYSTLTKFQKFSVLPTSQKPAQIEFLFYKNDSLTYNDFGYCDSAGVTQMFVGLRSTNSTLCMFEIECEEIFWTLPALRQRPKWSTNPIALMWFVMGILYYCYGPHYDSFNFSPLDKSCDLSHNSRIFWTKYKPPKRPTMFIKYSDIQIEELEFENDLILSFIFKIEQCVNTTTQYAP